MRSLRTPAPTSPAAAPRCRADFVAQLFGHTVPEDVVRYSAADLAMLAERAYDFLKDRQPGAPKLRCDTRRARRAQRKVVGHRDRQ